MRTNSVKSETCYRQNECLSRLDSNGLVIDLIEKFIHKNTRGTFIEMLQNDSVLQVTFNKNLGEVTIIVENVFGGHLYNNENNGVQNKVFISIAGIHQEVVR